RIRNGAGTLKSTPISAYPRENRACVLHPKSETEIISPLSRKGAASGEFKRSEAARAGILAGGGGQGECRGACGGSGIGFGSGPAGGGAMVGKVEEWRS